jgi:molybdate transport system regulatory protein
MANPKSQPLSPFLRPRLRVTVGQQIALGPGRIDLLELIDRTGSLRAAAVQMGLSYMRAWQMIRDSNAFFITPLVEVSRGGKGGGGAGLTNAGKQVLRLYRGMEKRCLSATTRDWKQMQKLFAHK